MIRSFISQAVEKAGFDEMEVDMLVLAVDEAVANVIEHAYSSDTTKEVSVRVVIEAGGGAVVDALLIVSGFVMLALLLVMVMQIG